MEKKDDLLMNGGESIAAKHQHISAVSRALLCKRKGRWKLKFIRKSMLSGMNDKKSVEPQQWAIRRMTIF